MKKNPTSQSGMFNPRMLCAFALCSAGALLAMFSLAATPLSELESSPSRKTAEVAGRNTTAPPALFRPDQLATGFASEASGLPPGVPLPSGMTSSPRDPRGAPFSVNQQGDPSSSGPTADFPSTPQAPAAAGGWTIVPSPSARSATNNVLSGVTCISASDCWAVGYSGGNSGGNPGTFIQHWDGTSWAVVPSPNVGLNDGQLNSVTCVSASDCWAVGYSGTVGFTTLHTLILRWDGTSWVIVPSPNVSAIRDNVLQSVTCVSALDCWAVGYNLSDSVTGAANQTLILRWNGTSWAIVTSPNTSAALDNVLYGVTCVSTSDCWAVGYSTGGASQTLVERWDGTSWAIVTSPNTSGLNNRLKGVTCASASDCWAVGYYSNGSANQTLILRWDGTLWTVVLSPNTSAVQSNSLQAVTCVSASNCWAVGSYNPGNTVQPGVDQTLVERWNGTSWTIVPSPNTNATQPNYLYGVTCVPGSACWAVGLYNTGGNFQTLIERWNGTSWTIVPSPNPLLTRSNYLYGVTCVSASDCWAVGLYEDAANFQHGAAFQNLIERWDGTSWTIVPSPNETTALYGVTCVSASDCWAVGYTAAGGASQTLIERWNGTDWTIVTSPNTSPTLSNSLSSVTCVSASDCWAVGYAYVNTNPQTLIERWNGTSWIIVASPNASGLNNVLSSVTCESGSDCWTVGYYHDGTAFRTLVERWNGAAWAIITSPNTSTTQLNFLQAVTCVSASDCWAVGQYIDGGASKSLIEQWDGASWAIVTSPNARALGGVTCVSASDCWAVGEYIERWTGTSWAIVTSPNIGPLTSVTCVSASDCWAVGYYYGEGGMAQTLIEHYTGSLPPTPTSVVSRKTHGTAGTFDINLPLTGNPGIECRSGGATNDYTMVFTFPNAVTFNSAAVTSGTGTVSSTSGSGTPAVTISLTGVTNAQTIAVTLFGVNDGTNTADVAVPMGVLLADTTASGSVNSSDISETKAQSGTVANSVNFRTDVTVNGLINSSDISTIKSKSGTALP